MKETIFREPDAKSIMFYAPRIGLVKDTTLTLTGHKGLLP